MVRQYQQFMALMNNYDYFKENVGIAEGSEGTLQKQADIYAESWEAASKRVRASAESLYQDLINDKFFISINNGIANVLSGLDAFIDKAGGLKTIITAVSGIFLSAFASKIPDAIKTAKYNLEVLTGGSQKAYQNIFAQMQESTNKVIKENNIDPNSSVAMNIKSANELAMVKNNYARIQDKLSSSEQQFYQTRMQVLQATNEEALAQQKLNEETKKALDLQQESLAKKDFSIEASSRLSKGADIAAKVAKGLQGTSGETSGNIFYESYESYKKTASQMSNQISQEVLKSFSNGVFSDTNLSVKLFKNLNFQQPTSDLEKMVNAMQAMANSSIEGDAKLLTFNNSLAALKRTIDPVALEASGLDKIFRELGNLKGPEEISGGINKLKEALKQANIPFEEFEKYAKEKYGTENIDKLAQGYQKVGDSVNTAMTQMNQASQKAKDLMNFQPKVELSTMMSSLAGATLSAVSSVQQLKSGLDALTDPDLSGWEKFSATLSAVATSIFTIKTTIEGASTVKKFFEQNNKIELFAKEIGGARGVSDGWDIFHKVASTQGKGTPKVDTLIKDNETKDIIRNTLATNLNSKAKVENAQKTLEQTLTSKGYSAEQAKEIAQKTIESAQDSAHTVILSAETKAYLARNAAMLAGIGVAALAIAGIVALAAAERKRAKEAEEKAVKVREEVEANKEIIDSNQELINSYEQLNKKLKETQSLYDKGQASTDDLSDAQDNLREKAKEVVDALKLEGASLDILSGSWDSLQQKIESKQQNEIAKQIKEEERAQVASEKALYYSNKENNLSGVLSGSFNTITQDNFNKGKYTNLGVNFETNAVQILNTSTGAAVAQGYESLQLLYDDLASTMTNSEKASSTILKNINSYLEANKEAYDRYKESEDNIQQLNIQSASFNAFGGVNKASSISSVEDYENYSQGMISFLANQKGITDKTSEAYKKLAEAVEAYLGTLDGVGDFQMQSKAFDDITKKTGIVKKDIQSFYNSLSEEKKTLFFNIDFDVAQTKEAFYKQLELLQSLADRDKIQSKIEVAETGIDLLGKSGATTDDWMAWVKRMQEADEDFNLEKFLNKTTDERNADLQGLKDQGKRDLANNRENTIKDYESQIKIAEQDKIDKKDDYNQALSSHWEGLNRLTELQEAAAKFANGEKVDFSSLGDSINDSTDLNNAITAQKEVVASNEKTINSYEKLDSAIEGYNNQIKDLQNEQLIEDTFGWRDALKEEAEALDISYDEVKEYAKTLQEVNSDLKDNEKLSEKIALAEKKQGKAVDDLIDNYKSYVSILNKAKTDSKIKSTEEYSKAIQSLRKDMSLLTGIEEDAFSDDFINSDKTQKALRDITNGVDGAIEKFRALAEVDVLKGEGLKISISKDYSTWDALEQDLVRLNQEDIEIGATVDNSAALDALAEMMQAARMTVEEMQQHFNELGWDPEITYKEVDAETASQLRSMGYQQYATLNPDGSYNIQSVPLEGNQNLANGSKLYVPIIGSKNKGGGGYKKIDVPKSAATKSPSSGGGGGGSKSTSHADTKSFSDKDRYHTVKNQLEDLNAQYDALDKAKDRAFGKSKLKEMDAEIAKTDELINKQKEYLREIEDYLPKDKAIMEKAYNEYIGGPGIEYDALGNISNFDAIQDAMFNKYNEMAGAYTDDSDEWKIFEKKYELLEKYIEQYEETYDLLRDERDKMQELINQKIDLGLEKVQYQVEVALEVPDDAIKVLEYRIGRIDDDAEKSLEAVSLLTKKAEQVYDKIQLNKQALNDVLKLSMSVSEINEVLAGNTAILAGKTFTEDQIDALKDYRDALIDLNGEFDDIRDNIEGKVMDVFDKWKEKLNTGIDTIEHYGNTLSSFRNIIDIVGKETLGITGDLMNKLAQSTVDVAIDKLKGTKRTYETIMASRDEAERRLQEAQARNDEASVKLWQENLETINEEVRSANEAMMQAWEDALSSIADNFENTVNDLVDTFQKSIYALGGLDGLSDDFSRQQENADLMLDDYQKIYELSKLSRDINKTIDDTDIISGKQKLKKLLGQINDLQADGNEMSKYDLEYLQKTYDLRLAEIELEEAQRAKNTVRLQKDSEGNWSYIYTQSSDAIDSAQQKYEDALYAMQDLSSNYIDEMSEKLISTSKDMQEALAAIRIQDYANIDDYYAEVERVQNKYQEQMDMQQNELQKAIDNNKELYDTDWTNYHNATGYKISDTEDFVTSFKDSLLGTLMDSESDAANFTDIIGDSVYNLTLGLMQAAETYYKNIEDAMNAAGTSTGDFAEDASENIDKVVDKSKEGTEAINNMAEQMTTAFDNITESVSQWQENYGMAMEKIIQSNLDVVESFNNMLAAMSINPDNITIKYDISNSAKDQKLSSFDTGGYTGEWNANGKLAVLHQKELVLNENDTANMLAVVQFTRSILDTIDLNAKAASLGLGTLSAIGLKDSNEQTLQQDVHITAEFPNVTNHTEIEEAMENLINHASQYVNRK